MQALGNNETESDEYFYYSIEVASRQDQTPRNDQDIPFQYKKINENNADRDCRPTPIKGKWEWNNYQHTFIDACSGKFKEYFFVTGSTTRTKTRGKIENNQRMDRHNTSSISKIQQHGNNSRWN